MEQSIRGFESLSLRHVEIGDEIDENSFEVLEAEVNSDAIFQGFVNSTETVWSRI